LFIFGKRKDAAASEIQETTVRQRMQPIQESRALAPGIRSFISSLSIPARSKVNELAVFDQHCSSFRVNSEVKIRAHKATDS